MSRFYGQVHGQANTTASRRGGRDIKASVQSWNGSVIMRMYYDSDDRLNVNVQVADSSSFIGESIFDGTFEEFKKKLQNKDRLQGE